MKKLRTAILQIIFLLVACTLCAVTVVREDGKAVPGNAELSNTIILDAGHGGFDGGAQASDGTLEKDINLSIALRLRSFLEQGGFEVIMIRETDTGIESDSDQTIAKRKVSDMKKRLEIINSNPGAVFVSIHLNKFTTSTAKGAQVFYSPNCETSSILAESVQSSIINLIQPDNTRTIKRADKSIYLLKNAKIPAVIVECGFLSNKNELELLKKDEYQSKMAFAIYCGLLNYCSEN